MTRGGMKRRHGFDAELYVIWRNVCGCGMREKEIRDLVSLDGKGTDLDQVDLHHLISTLQSVSEIPKIDLVRIESLSRIETGAEVNSCMCLVRSASSTATDSSTLDLFRSCLYTRQHHRPCLTTISQLFRNPPHVTSRCPFPLPTSPPITQT